ncbi:molecular chaperone DnaK [Catenulispora sp. GAS73]|uniref:Hsp70 family protein n=1 Tax=Catenulispora sp. GAS73 TaxID=3156269 RepID=UPI003511110F
MKYPLGVDVGTTYTAAAIWRDGRVESVPLGNRANAIPSVLFVRDDGTVLVGEPAVLRGIAEPGRQAREFKRRMGDEVPLLVGEAGYTAPELTAQVLRWTVERVTEVQGGPPGHVVLTHPAEWGAFRQGLLTEAAMAAGLTDVGLLPEPVAAATWYAAQERVEAGALIGVYDFGGGTFDAAVVAKTGTGLELFGPAGGDDSIGGVDFDHALLRHVAAAAGVDLAAFDRSDPAAATAVGQLFDAVVRAKEALSGDTEAVVPVVLPGFAGQVLVTRAEFEDLIRPAVRETVSVFGQVVRRAGVGPEALRTVLLVGGSSRIPLVARMLSEELGVPIAVDAHPKHTVSLGAVIAGAPRGANAGTFQIPRPATTIPLAGTGPSAAGASGGDSGAASAVDSGAASAGDSAAAAAAASVAAHLARSGSPKPTAFLPAPGSTDALPLVPGTLFLPGPGSTETVPVAGPVAGPATAPVVAPVVAEPVDLAASALTAAVDVPVLVGAVPVIDLGPRPRPATVVRTSDREAAVARAAGPGRLRPLLALTAVIAAVGIVVGVAVAVKHKDSSGTGGGSSPVGTPGSSAGAVSAPGGPGAPTAATAVHLAGGPVGTAATQSPDTMRAATALPSGALVAVGVALDQAPRAWLKQGGGTWSAVAAPPADQFATLADVAATPSGAVAVGWTGSGAQRRAAVWTTRDGTSWKLLGPAGDFTPGSGVTELTAVTATADHHLLAVGQDRKSDPTDGDAAVFTSPDGATWTRVPATGLSGPGPQDIRRLTRTADGHLLAIGSALSGAHQAPAVWTSPDGVAWQPTAIAPDDSSASLQAVTQQPDGTLLACGTTGAAGSETVACWTQHDARQTWQQIPLTAPPNAPPVYLYDLLRTPAGLLAVGAARSGTAIGAAGWTVTQGS